MTNPATTWYGDYQELTNGPSARSLAESFEAELAEIGRNRFPRACEPIIVRRASYRQLLDDTKRLLALHSEAVLRLAGDDAGRVSALGADPDDFPRFCADEDFEQRHAVDVCRADVLISADGPKFLELNVGAGIGGILEFEIERRIWEQVQTTAGGPSFGAPGIYELMAALVKRTFGELGAAGPLLLVGTVADPGKTSRYFDLQIQLLREHGVSTRVAEIGSLADAMRQHPNRPVLGLMQFGEREANTIGIDLSPLATAMADGLYGIPSQSARLLDSKKVLALLSEQPAWLAPSDREVVRRTVPWSRIVGDRKVEWRDAGHELPELLLDRQEEFVLKGSAGYSSQEVFFGNAMTPDEWRGLIDRAVESEYFIAQEVVVGVRHPVKAMMDLSGNVESVLANARISPFVIGNTATGCYSRFDPNDRVGPIARPFGAWPACILPGPR